MTDITVVPDLLVIPDGVEGTDLRLTIKVAPRRLDDGSGAVELDDWPSWIAEHAQRIRLTFAAEGGNSPVQLGTRIECASPLWGFFDGAHPGQPFKRHQAATQLWRTIFDPGIVDGFDLLAQAVSEAENSLYEPAAKATGHDLLGPRLLSSATSDVSVVLDRLFAALNSDTKASRGGAGPSLAGLRQVFGASSRAATHVSAGSTADPFCARAARIAAIDDAADALARSLVATKGKPTELARGAVDALQQVFAMHDRALAPDPEFPTHNNFPCEPVPPAHSGIDTAKRKLSAIEAIPTLAHYFGLAIQIRIPVAALTDRSAAALLRAEFLAADGTVVPGQISTWTAYEYFAAGKDHPVDHFGPRDQVKLDEAPGSFPYQAGLLQLAARLGAKPRFRVDSTDVVNTLYRLREALQRDDDTHNDEVIAKLAKLRRGIAVFDRHAVPAAAAAFSRELELGLLPDDEPKINYLRELVMGFRPDVAIIDKRVAGLPTRERWRPLTARRVFCEDTKTQLFDHAAFYAQPAIKGILDHDHGVTMVPQALRPAVESGVVVGEERIDEEDMFVWAGESLGLPAQPGKVEVDSLDDLGIEITYRYTDIAEEHLPPLRDGREYLFGCRLVLPNGAGLPLRSALSLYAAQYSDDKNPFLIGDAVDAEKPPEPYPFPPEKVPAPQILLDRMDPLVTAPDEAVRRGETSDTLVVRDGNGALAQKRIIRFVAPPRVAFDGGEIQGLFDSEAQKKESIPLGAFVATAPNAPGVPLRLGKNAQFPEAREGKIWFREGLMPDGTGTTHWEDADNSANDKATLKSSRGAVALFEKSTEGAVRFYASLYGKTLAATLSSAPGPAYPSSLGATSVALSTERRPNFWPGSDPVAACPIVIEVVRSSNKVTTFNATPLDPVKISGVALPQLRIDLAPGDTVQLELSAATEPSHKTKLNLVSAVQLPAQRPSFTQPTRVTERFGMNAITVTADGASNWATIVADYGGDMLDWPSRENGGMTFFVGRVAIDRKTTGSLSCVVGWDEFDEKRLKRVSDLEWTERENRQNVLAFSLEVEIGGGPNWIDLLRDPDGVLRGFSHSFPDGRARRLAPVITATSRFEKYFDTSVTECTVNSSTLPDVWVECTFRPPPPRIDRVLPYFDWESRVRGKVRTVRRSTEHLRLYLDEGWYASGEGEMLGVVLLPDNAVPPDPFAPFLTRTGGDPTRPGEHERSYLHASNFPTYKPADFVDNVSLYLSGDGTDAAANRSNMPFAVSILTLGVERDDDTGQPYCDLDIATLGAYTPFVQLGLVRFQPHSVNDGATDLRCSTPIQFQAQLLPSRTLTVTGDDTQRKVLLTGPGYASVDYDGVKTRSSLGLSVLEWNSDYNRWDPSENTDPNPHPDWEPKFDKGDFIWDGAIDLPNSGEAPQMALLVEEFEHMPSDKPLGTYDGNGLADFDVSTEKRIVFSHLLRIRDV